MENQFEVASEFNDDPLYFFFKYSFICLHQVLGCRHVEYNSCLRIELRMPALKVWGHSL